MTDVEWCTVFDRDLLARVGRKGGADDGYSPGQRVNNDGAAGGELAGGYGAESLFSTLGGDVASSLDASPATKPVTGQESPTDVAEQGFTGGAQPLPYKAELEQQFGVPLDGVETYTGDSAAHANSKLGANAYASGNRIAFGAPNPQKSLVAHELTHVLQHTGTGPATKSPGGGGGVETGGEAEAERVESAVAQGRSVKSALDIDPRKVSAMKGPGPALKQAGQRPALSSPFTSGLTFSPHGMEQSGSVTLWHGHGLRAPIAAVPGLFLTLTPEVFASVSGGVDWSRNVATAQLGITGAVLAGLSYGDPHLAEIYANMEAAAVGRFRYERGRAPLGTGGAHGEGGHGGHAAHAAAPTGNNNWSLDGAIALETAFNVGVRLGGGIIDKRFQFGHCEIGSLNCIRWVNGRLVSEGVRWEWGPMPRRFFAEVNTMIRRARDIMRMPAEAAQRAWRGLADGTGAIYHGIVNGAANLYHALNPFD